MNREMPDSATMLAALEVAARAPSAGNAQPWRWVLGPSGVHLFAEVSDRRPYPALSARERVVSCGAALHHCVVALAELGWRVQVRRFPDQSDPDHIAALTLHRDPAVESEPALTDAIPQRQSDRRCYSDRVVAANLIAALSNRATQSGVVVRELTMTPRIRRVMAAHRDDADHAVFLVLGTANDRPSAWLRAGEATSMILLRATAHGLASCALTEPLAVPETREAIQRAVFGDLATPQVLIRVGWAPAHADPLPPTRRRPVAEMVTRLDGPTKVGVHMPAARR